MSHAVVIENVLWSGDSGGAIFNGTTLEGNRYRFVASSTTMPRSPLVGEVWEIAGTRREHPVHGEQVEVCHCILQRPSGRLIVKVLSSSRAFPGIGVVTAKRLWEEFGEELYTLLDQGFLSTFAGLIGEDLANALILGWQQMSVDAAVYRWLDTHGVALWLAKKLLAIYGNEVIQKLEENPYRLLAFTSWKQADNLARGCGIAPDDERRLAAAGDAAVYGRLASNHTWTPCEVFKQLLGKLLGSEGASAERSFQVALRDRAVVELNGGIQGLGPYSMESFIAERMAEMVRGNFQFAQMTIRQTPDQAATAELIAQFEKIEGISLNAEQKDAVHLAVTAPLAVICGGAGVGKTTVLSAIYSTSEALGAQVYQLALSGRAARRIEEATGRPAQTIASWLAAVDAENISLDTEPTIAIDEASMLDLPTTYRILRRLEPGCRLLLLGDTGQLPPIGFGIVFHAVVDEPAIPRVELIEIVRQAASTGIPQASRAIRQGHVTSLDEYKGLGHGVSFIDCPDTEIINSILDVINDFGGIDKCQVIGATKNGPAGVKTVNTAFHELLSPGKPQIHGYAEGEPVIWLHNDHDLNLLNGSLGVIVRADTELVVRWDSEGEKVMEPSSLDNMDLAYGITVHKSQGSQFPRVIVPIYQSRLLDRTLLYTAITRAQSQVVLIGDRTAFEQAVTAPPSPSRRETAINVHLAKACSPNPCPVASPAQVR